MLNIEVLETETTSEGHQSNVRDIRWPILILSQDEVGGRNDDAKAKERRPAVNESQRFSERDLYSRVLTLATDLTSLPDKSDAAAGH